MANVSMNNSLIDNSGKILLVLIAGFTITFVAGFFLLLSQYNTIKTQADQDTYWNAMQLDHRSRTLKKTLRELANTPDDPELNNRLDDLLLEYIGGLDRLEKESITKVPTDISSVTAMIDRLKHHTKTLSGSIQNFLLNHSEQSLQTTFDEIEIIVSATDDLIIQSLQSQSRQQSIFNKDNIALLNFLGASGLAMSMLIIVLVILLFITAKKGRHSWQQERQLRQSLSKALAQAQHASKVQSTFLATMSHEIRTPITGVSGMAGLLLETPLNKEQKHYTEVIRQSADAVLTIINEVLDFSKLEANQLTFQHAPFELNSLVESAFNILSPNFKQRPLQIESSIDPTLSKFYTSDSGRIRQILLNLLSNAIKFTEHGSIKLMVTRLEGNDVYDNVLFEVIDTGIGIEQSALNTLFEKFTQVPAPPDKKYPGTGLGLSICKKLVSKMKGDIGVESEAGKGSRFWFRIPLERFSTEPSTVKSAPSASEHKDNPLNILVVDDIATNQLLLKKMLENYGHQVLTVNSGQEAIDVIGNSGFDLVFMDVRMPTMDGLTATQIIRNMGFAKDQLPIIATSANSATSDRNECLAAGMNDFLAKPIDREKLNKLLVNFAGHYQAQL